MKQILITISAIIILLLGYNIYVNYKRFNPPNLEFVTQKKIDLDCYDKSLVQNYFLAKENLNSYILEQWNEADIDVRNPKSYDAENKNAVAIYNQKLANFRYFESLLEQSLILKKTGLKNEQIANIGLGGMTNEEAKSSETKGSILQLFDSNPNLILKENASGSLVFEIQKLLSKKGFKCIADGQFRTETMLSIQKFQQTNQLLPTGEIDIFTIKKLLE